MIVVTRNEPEIDLDDPSRLSEIDRSGMLGALDGFPDQLRTALDIAHGDVALPDAAGLKAIVVLGMGGSGMSGDVAAALPADGFPVPFVTVKGYGLPAFVDGSSLVFAVSYSGNTEETLDCFEESLSRGARVVAVTSGGRLAELAAEHDVPLFRIPGGMQPRASLGYLVVPVVCSLQRMGLASGLAEAIEGSAAMLEGRSREYAVTAVLDDNPTKRLAKDLVGCLPVVYGQEGALAVTAMRWKAQFNENAKVPAFSNAFPELNHNETVGWEHLDDVRSRCHLIVLREPDEHPRVKKRIEITIDLLEDYVAHVVQICARGANRVERLFDLIYFGDYASVYLALAMGQDPTPVTRIEELKKRLAEGR